ncbi:MAG: hypothetical protein ABIJ59_10050 [Pseudomonadota bacterium]
MDFYKQNTLSLKTISDELMQAFDISTSGSGHLSGLYFYSFAGGNALFIGLIRAVTAGLLYDI